MKILLAAITCLVLSACASDTNVQRLIHVGKSCAALGKGMDVSREQPPLWRYYEPDANEVKCRA